MSAVERQRPAEPTGEREPESAGWLASLGNAFFPVALPETFCASAIPLMNTKPKLIADIRFYENPGRTEYGNVRHDSLGTMYSVPFRSFGAIGDRFACKLREYELTLPGFDHVYVILTPSLPSGTVEQSSLNVDGRIRYIDVGLLPQQWNTLTDDSKHDHLVDLTSAAIGTFTCNQGLLNDVSSRLKQCRSQLEIIVKTKDTSSYRVDVSYQIRPLQEQSIAFLTYADKRSGQRGRTILTRLLSADDVYPLCGSIAIRNNTVTIKPRSSSRAATLTQKYSTPMSVAVDTILAASGTEPTDEREPK